MIREQIGAQTKETICKKYDDYREGKTTKDEWTIYLLDLLENYFKSRISKKHRTMSAEFDDLMQQSRLAVIENIDKYNPHISMPTSYFTNFIEQYTREALNNVGLTTHYIAAAVKLEKAAKQHGFTGMTDPNLSPDTLAVLADVSVNTVINTIQQKQISVVSLSVTNENFESTSPFASPENVCLEKERVEFITEQVNKLSPLEKFLIQRVDLADKPESYRSILKYLKRDGNIEQFRSEIPNDVNQIFLEQKHNYAIRRIKYSPAAKRYIGEDTAPAAPIAIEEQALTSDIDAAVTSGLVFD